MRILLVQDTDWLQRGPHQQHHIMEQLSLCGHEVTVVDFPLVWRSHEGRGLVEPARDDENVARLYEGARVRLVRPAVPRLPLVDKASILLVYRRVLARLLRGERPDVVVGMGILTDRIARRLAAQVGIPYVAFLIDALHRLLDIPPLRGLARRWEAQNLAGADRVIVINQALADYASSMGAGRIEVVPSGVDGTRVAVGDRAATRRALGIGPDTPVLLFMGWLYPFCGVDRVARQIQASDLDVHLLVVGGGDLEARVRRIADSDPRSRIHLTGWRPFETMPEYLAAADVCILPSDINDTMRHIVPIKLYEYLGAGKPLLSTPIDSVRRELGGHPGVRFEDDRYRFADEALRMLDDGVDEAAAAEAPAFRKRHAWPELAKRFETVLHAVVQEAA